MDRKQALTKLEQMFLQEKSELMTKFEALVKQHHNELVEQIYEGILALAQTHPVEILQIQLMRADIYQGKCKFIVCGYDKSWYLDEKRTESFMEADFLYEPFLDLIEKMTKQISIYMGAVTIYDIKNLICEYFIELFQGLSNRFRKDFMLFDEWALANQLQLRRPYGLVWGVFKEKVDLLLYVDRTKKGGKELYSECDADRKQGKELHYCYSFIESEIEEVALQREKFVFLNMKNSTLKNTTFETCIFGQCMFQNSKMDWIEYKGSTLYGCNLNQIRGYQLNFQEAEVQNCSFEQLYLRKGNFNNATLTDVVFTDGILEECSFQNARLKNVDLRIASLEGVDFTGAELENVYINPNLIEQIELTREQSEGVYVWKKEGTDEVL